VNITEALPHGRRRAAALPLHACRVLIVCLLSLAGGDAQAQSYDTDCKDQSASGRYECTPIPQRIGPWWYSVTAGAKTTPYTLLEDEAIAMAKQNIAANAGPYLCSPVVFAGWPPYQAHPAPTPFDFNRLARMERHPILFTLGFSRFPGRLC
jgi:hypothetical protein